jgi:hypothetical protein
METFGGLAQSGVYPSSWELLFNVYICYPFYSLSLINSGHYLPVLVYAPYMQWPSPYT